MIIQQIRQSVICLFFLLVLSMCPKQLFADPATASVGLRLEVWNMCNIKLMGIVRYYDPNIKNWNNAIWEADSQQNFSPRTSSDVTTSVDPNYDVYFAAGSEDGSVKIKGEHKFPVMGNVVDFRLYGKPERFGDHLRLFIFCN